MDHEDPILEAFTARWFDTTIGCYFSNKSAREEFTLGGYLARMAPALMPTDSARYIAGLRPIKEEEKMSLYNKLRVVILGHANDLLNKTIDMNSPVILEQYARDLKVAVNQADSNAAESAAAIVTMKRELTALQTQVATATEVARKLALDPNGKAMALAKAKLIIELNKQAASKQDEITQQTASSQALDQVVLTLKGKLATINARVQSLRSMDRDTKAKTQSAATLKQASDLLDTGNDIDVDNVEACMQAQHDIANEKFNRQIASMDVSSAEDNSEAEELLASLTPVQSHEAAS